MSATDNDLERHFGELQAHAASMLLDSQAGVDGGCLSDTDSDISATELSRRQLRNKRLSPHAREDLRLRINCRERQRMHDLNMAMDSLRQVMPYAHGPSVKKLSKMSTLLLARNYIMLLTRSVEDLRRLLRDVYCQRSLVGLEACVKADLLRPSATVAPCPTVPHPAYVLPSPPFPTELHSRVAAKRDGEDAAPASAGTDDAECCRKSQRGSGSWKAPCYCIQCLTGIRK
ncbi:hypothetical protein LSAT2_006160 [Lamellibrachia satsuma]|nr:hypothetical protein LSAT2_006160 [Lamellibrachia satsuma]